MSLIGDPKEIYVEGLPELQARSAAWGEETFAGMPHWKDRIERGKRFLEEAMELAQAVGVTREDAEALVGYTFERPVGEVNQEIGGVMHTLMILGTVEGIDVLSSAKQEMLRCEQPEVREKIRGKQVSKLLAGIGGTVPRNVGMKPGLEAPYGRLHVEKSSVSPQEPNGRDPMTLAECQDKGHDWYEPVGSHGMTEKCAKCGVLRNA